MAQVAPTRAAVLTVGLIIPGDSWNTSHIFFSNPTHFFHLLLFVKSCGWSVFSVPPVFYFLGHILMQTA